MNRLQYAFALAQAKGKGLVSKQRLARSYLIVALLILLSATLLWAWLGASVHQDNADQLVNVQLFENQDTFKNASLPNQHTFLFKWPLFLLVHVLGASNRTFTVVTVLVALVTVGLLAFIIYRIERRPLVCGTLLLALASVLLLVPPAPYAGGILPVNMAMLTTRNLEYIVFMTSIVLLIRSPSPKRIGFWLAALTLALLGVSDKLFLVMNLFGGTMALLCYMCTRRWRLVRLVAAWLGIGVLATAIAMGVVWLLNTYGVTNIVGNGRIYDFVQTPKQLALGIIFGGLGILTNFGANPMFDARVLVEIPKLAFNRLLSPSGPTYLMNLLIFAGSLWAAARMMLITMKKSTKVKETDRPVQLSLLLVWSSVGAIISFVVSNHYSVVDARYLTIVLFALFISVATRARKTRYSSRLLLRTGLVMVVVIALGLFSAVHTFHDDKTALADVKVRNDKIAAALKAHTVGTLVGDYWRVVPIKQDLQQQRVTPLESCTTPREVLSSKRWQPDLRHHSFAYLLTIHKSLTGYPGCSLDTIVQRYGQPNSSVLLAGTPDAPEETLLFYDQGVHSNPKPNKPTVNPSNTVLPTDLDQLPPEKLSCPGNTTIMNVVAHQDDDLLFISPALLHDIQAKHCIRTVYVTAGDAGSGQLYWLKREKGSEVAYANMIGMPDVVWVQRTVKLSAKQYVTIASPHGNQQVALVFMHLPDGNVSGSGFAASGYESLRHLEISANKLIRSVDGQSVYDADQLVTALASLMQSFQPDEIRTQMPYSVSRTRQDHSDHTAVGRFTRRAYEQYRVDHPDALINYYIGYPIGLLEQNVTGEDLIQKTDAFLDYAQFDDAVCHTAAECNNAVYNLYLQRQYAATPAY